MFLHLMYIHIFVTVFIKMDIGTAIQQKKFRSEHEKLIVNLLYTSGWLQANQVRFFKQYDLSPEQYNVLRILRGQYPKATSVSLVQERMLDKMSNASRLIDKLKLKGLVSRTTCSNDRRQVDVKITEAGLNLLETIDKERDDIENLMGTLKIAEAKTLNNLLDKLRTNNK
jgi:DNA-binding MarR family transcriptional regulator